MNRPGFFEGVGMALLLASMGAAGLMALGGLFAGPFLLRWLLMALAGTYVLYLLARSPHRAGRVASAVIWLGGALGVWLLAPTFTWFTAAHVALIWLVRAFHHHRTVLGAVADLGLGALGFIVAVAAARQTGSLFLAVWCFFLVQALFVGITRLRLRRNRGARDEAPTDDFDKAARTAELALRRLAS